MLQNDPYLKRSLLAYMGEVLLLCKLQYYFLWTLIIPHVVSISSSLSHDFDIGLKLLSICMLMARVRQGLSMQRILDILVHMLSKEIVALRQAFGRRKYMRMRTYSTIHTLPIET